MSVKTQIEHTLDVRAVLFLWFFSFVLVLIVYCVCWGCFGGWMNFDTQVQWAQVQEGVYTQWHPFVHTFLMMKVPSLL